MKHVVAPHVPILRGTVKLATQSVLGLSDLVEDVHRSVLTTLGLPGSAQPGRTAGVTGLVYASVRGITRGVGGGVDAVLSRLPALGLVESASGRREALLAALNGVLGDHLAASANPIATVMSLRHQGRSLATSAALPGDAARPHVIVMLHGLCMNERQWLEPKSDDAVEPAAVLGASLDCTVLHLRYNSGLPTATNGRLFAHLLERELRRWPVAPSRVSLVGHSMGGLVARHAIATAQAEGFAWPALLGDLVCLGTPHLGAPLERIGHWVDGALRSTRWSAPFARLGGIRSAGITDLRHGLRPSNSIASALPPLPMQTRQHLLAATLAGRRNALADRLLGDGLVPLRSALGEAATPELSFDATSRHIVYRAGHLELLHHREVAAQLVEWLALPSPIGSARDKVARY
jgi:pimeloyl-ACP methyl ester carboxylesterase